MKKIRPTTVFLQNIISPYRARFFNVLQQHYEDFAVFYMGKNEPGKFWDTSNIEMNYKYWVDRLGLYLKFSDKFDTHFNLLLLFKIFFTRKIKNIVLAVSWTDLNVMIIAIIKKLHLTRKRIFFWAEANYLAEWTTHKSKLIKWLKRIVFSSVDGAMIVPGKMAIMSFERWEIPLKDYILLPNSINDSELIFEGKEKSNALPVFVMPMRLIEGIKGGLNFFNSIGLKNIRKALFIIAGDGVDYEKYQTYVQENDLSDHIILKGFCNTSQMNDIYNSADAFILPSYFDCSPLSVVEAIYMHLPLLISENCGNHFEAVKEGENGYLFNPYNQHDIKDKFEIFMSKLNEWEQMGDVSALIYENSFNTHRVVKRFADEFKARMRVND